MRAACVVAGWLLGGAVAQNLPATHTNYAQPASWDPALAWEPNAAEWYKDGWNGTARTLRFQPNVAVDMFAGRPFRLTLQDASSELWDVRLPLPGNIVAEVLGVNTDAAGVVHVDLMAAATAEAGDDSGYIVVGYPTTVAGTGQWYTQPVAVKLYAPGVATSRGAAGSAEAIDDSEWGWAGGFFIIFLVFDVTIVVGLIGHYAATYSTWQSPPEAKEEVVAAGIVPGGAGKSQMGAASAYSASVY